jgi:glycosyltransferase involved in cell wall biosynthesis
MSNAMPKFVLMIGTGLSSPGGMTAVVQTMIAAGLVEQQNLRYVSTYEGGGFRRQMRVTFIAAITLLKALVRREVRLLHAHSASRGSFWRKSMFSAMARMFQVPYVFQIHSGEFPIFYNNECGAPGRWWVRHTLTHAATVICLTPGWREAILSIAPKSKVAVLANPVHVPDSLPECRTPARTVLFLGRLREKKGIFDLLEAIPTVLAAFPNLRFVLAGDEGEQEVMIRARDLGIDHAIELPGWVDGARKEKLQTSADIFVLPSYFEGLPMGVLEAMALGIAVVSTNVGGIPELIASGEDGLLISPGDSKALADSIIRLCRDSRFRQDMRNSAYGKARLRYCPEIVLQRLNLIYQRCDEQ